MKEKLPYILIYVVLCLFYGQILWSWGSSVMSHERATWSSLPEAASGGDGNSVIIAAVLLIVNFTVATLYYFAVSIRGRFLVAMLVVSWVLAASAFYLSLSGAYLYLAAAVLCSIFGLSPAPNKRVNRDQPTAGPLP